MNTFKLHSEISKNNNGQVNIIDNCNKGYSITTIKERSVMTEVVRNSIVFYPTIEELILNSPQFKKYESLNTVVITRKGTDCANWIVKSLKK